MTRLQSNPPEIIIDQSSKRDLLDGFKAQKQNSKRYLEYSVSGDGVGIKMDMKKMKEKRHNSLQMPAPMGLLGNKYKKRGFGL